jgi:hypothetical protein
MDAYSSGFDLDLFPELPAAGPLVVDLARQRLQPAATISAMDMEATDPLVDQRRQPRVRDPHVVVPRYMEAVPPLLTSEAFNLDLELRFPLLDWANLREAVHHYLAVRQHVHDSLDLLEH